MQRTSEGREVKRNKNVFFVGLLSFFGGISQDVFSPILPLYLTTVLGFDKSFVGIAEGVVTASVNIVKVATGYISDKFKKQKPLIFLGYGLSMIARPLLAIFTSGVAVVGLRIMDGAGKGVKDPPKDVLIAGSANKESRGKSFGIARMLDTLGSVAGPMILFGLLYFLKDSPSVYHWILLLSAVPLVITLIVLVLKVREAPITQQNTTVPALTTKKALPSVFYLFLMIAVLFTLGNSSDAFLILRARNLGVPVLYIPVVIALFNLVYAAAAVPFGSLSDRIGRIPTILIGWGAYTLVYLGFGLASHAWLIWVLYGAYGVYYATSEGVAKALLADLVGPDHRGRAYGIYGTTLGITALPASFFAGYLWDKVNPSAPFIFGASMAAVAAVCLALLSRKLKHAV